MQEIEQKKEMQQSEYNINIFKQNREYNIFAHFLIEMKL